MTRHSSTKRGRNFLPSLIITALLWLSTGLLIYFVDPSVFGAVPLLFATIFLALFFTLALVLGNSKNGLVASVCLLAFLFLRFFGIGNIVNFLLIAGLGVSVVLYLR